MRWFCDKKVWVNGWMREYGVCPFAVTFEWLFPTLPTLGPFFDWRRCQAASRTPRWKARTSHLSSSFTSRWSCRATWGRLSWLSWSHASFLSTGKRGPYCRSSCTLRLFIACSGDLALFEKALGWAQVIPTRLRESGLDSWGNEQLGSSMPSFDTEAPYRRQRLDQPSRSHPQTLPSSS